MAIVSHEEFFRVCQNDKHSSKQLNPLSANATKWSNTLKQFVGKLPMNYLSLFDHFVGLALKGLIELIHYLVEPPSSVSFFEKGVRECSALPKWSRDSNGFYKKCKVNRKKAWFILRLHFSVYFLATRLTDDDWRQCFHMLIWYNFGCLKTYFTFYILHSSDYTFFSVASCKILAQVTIICFMINIFSSSIINHRVHTYWKVTEICSKLTIKISERPQWRSSGVFIVNSKYVSHLFLVLLLLTFNFVYLS